MPEIAIHNELISIIIPCYNGASYIEETLHSILQQNNVNFEIILIDDGSTDDTKSNVLSINESRIHYHYQNNSGVSKARNEGLKLAKGEYLVFFDADDKMEPHFLDSRLSFLKENENVDFVCGEVVKFKNENLLPGYFRGTSANAIHEILLYNQEVITCPSNYLFRKKFLSQNNLNFNENLSSTADKYFILLCSRYGKSDISKKSGKLLYRISDTSMSHQLTEKLVLDNAQYYIELIKSELIPAEIKSQSLSQGYFMLFGANWRINNKLAAVTYLLKSFFCAPLVLLKLFFTRLLKN